MTTIRLPGVIAIEAAATSKLAPQDHQGSASGRERPVPRAPFCSATYVSIEATCTDGCLFKGAGCFAQSGFIKRFTGKLDDQARDWDLTGLEVIHNECLAISEMFGGGPVPQDGRRGGRDLRLHVGGDVSCAAGARALAGAAREWSERGGGRVWSYSHRWREIPADAWGPISVFASCETPRAAEQARKRGYRAALTVESFKRDARYAAPHGTSIIPCPSETRGRVCIECRLCLDARLPEGAAIGFALHGNNDSLSTVRNAWRGANNLDLLPESKRRLPILEAAE